MNENLHPVLDRNEQTSTSNNAENNTNFHQSNNYLLTKEDILTQLRNLANSDDVPARSEVETLKQSFYKIRSAEIQALKESFIADGGEPEAFLSPKDEIEEEFKILLAKIKDSRAKLLQKEQEEKDKNLEAKLQIIDSIKKLTEDGDLDFNTSYKEFKNLQQQWNNIKLVPASKVNELWKSYQISTEKFYDLIRINNEFRDYDFKKNLELKIAICNSVEKLLIEADIISAFHQLQNFHEQWREIGPVAKDLRDDIWNRFKNASTEINKKYQAHFEQLKAQEESNLIEKTAICDTLSSIDYSSLKSFKDWDEKSKEVLDLQSKWKTIGYVPKKLNSKIFDQYRRLCDIFFENKAEYFKVYRAELEDNLKKKRALLDRAILLKNSTDWKSTTDELISIQKEWKTIGAVPRKYSDSLWKEFVETCDYFFDQKNKNLSTQKEEETQNLAKKRELIQKISQLSDLADPKEAMDTLRSYIEEWHAIGFVPYKEKDKIYKEYQSVLDAQFDRLKVDKSERRMQSFKSNLQDIVNSDNPKGRLYRERDRLVHQLNKVKSDLMTYENNMGFLSISKGAGGLLKEMEHKIQDLKNEVDFLSKKIDTIDDSLNAVD